MGKLITLGEYFNSIGKKLFPRDWSNETVYYYSERKKEFKDLKEYARVTYSKALNQIWKDGKVKISVRLEQGYIDPPFAIVEFDFAHSGCISKGGDYYRCMLEPTKKETRGRKKEYDLDDIIREYAIKFYISKGISLKKIKPESVINYVTNFLLNQNMKVPHGNTIRIHLYALYPGCKKENKDSNK